MKTRMRLTRRSFLAAAGATSVVALTGCGGGGGTSGPSSRTVFRLSTRNVGSASNAAKAHAANKRFVSALVADANRAHLGDRSRIVPITVSSATWDAWFGGGKQVIDLRTI